MIEIQLLQINKLHSSVQDTVFTFRAIEVWGSRETLMKELLKKELEQKAYQQSKNNKICFFHLHIILDWCKYFNLNVLSFYRYIYC